MTPMVTPRLKKHCPIAAGNMSARMLLKSHCPSYWLSPSFMPSKKNPRMASTIRVMTGTGMVKYTN